MKYLHIWIENWFFEPSLSSVENIININWVDEFSAKIELTSIKGDFPAHYSRIRVKKLQSVHDQLHRSDSLGSRTPNCQPPELVTK